MQQYIIILTTMPDKASAGALARELIANKLAACVNILPQMTSIYEWKNSIETGEEHLLLIKTRKSRYQDVETHIRKQHSYELPEIIAVPIEAGLPAYLNWIDEQISA